jgi:hypothetical protein
MLFLFYNTSYLNEEVNCTVPSPSARVPWLKACPRHWPVQLQTSVSSEQTNTDLYYERGPTCWVGRGAIALPADDRSASTLEGLAPHRATCLRSCLKRRSSSWRKSFCVGALQLPTHIFRKAWPFRNYASAPSVSIERASLGYECLSLSFFTKNSFFVPSAFVKGRTKASNQIKSFFFYTWVVFVTVSHFHPILIFLLEPQCGVPKCYETLVYFTALSNSINISLTNCLV